MSLPPRMSAESTERFTRAGDDVLSAAEAGKPLTDAAVKAAHKHGLPIEHVPLFCKTLNAALVESHRKCASTAEARMSDEDLIDPDEAVNQLRNLPTTPAKLAAVLRHIPFDPNATPR